MKYYIELTVSREDPLTHYISEDFRPQLPLG